MFESLETRRMLTTTISISGARLTIDGTDGPDILVVNQVSPTHFQIYDNGSATDITSSKYIRQIVINGMEDDDTLVLLPSVDTQSTLNGDGGNDTMVGGLGADDFKGKGGTDTVSYFWRSENLRLSIDDVANDGFAGISEGDNIETDVENVTGGCGNDVIIGDDDDNTLPGLGGDDDIFGMDGNDLIDGGAGHDQLHGGDGCDTIFGGDGCDFLNGDDGDDELWSNDPTSPEEDNVVGGEDYDTAYVNGAVDTVDSQSTEDVNFVA